MFGNLFSGWHVVILLAVVLLLFGATKLPALAKGLGESVRILRKETTKSGDQSAGGDSDTVTGSAGEAPGEPKPLEPKAAEPKPVESKPVESKPAEPPASDAPAADPPQRD
ncbi:twin-arginine translocase TatA/TatE family subunit [Leifsonia sp. McL0607]|uniref:twin-arginine translocase TatA/TatE family subunit n=1 Tax=Leifsonia sp. McL0607 TaxID=3415672 RepID=UPI003CF71890